MEDYVRIVGPNKDDVVSSIKWTEGAQTAKLDVVFEPTSTMPVDEERETERYLKAFELVGDALLPEVLKQLKIPNVDDVIKRHGILGPFQQLMEVAQENGISSEDVVAAIQQALGSLNELNDNTTGQPQPQTQQ